MLLTFEGIDGSGKSTQIELLQERLEQHDIMVNVFREPGGTALSEQVRSLLLDSDWPLDPVTELMLFSAARSQLVIDEVIPRLEREEVVILDRFYDSTTAYQGYGHGTVSLEAIQKINLIAGHGLEPDFTFYMRISLEKARKRIDGMEKDRMERQKSDFYKRVIEGFDELARKQERFVTLNATWEVEEIHEEIWEYVTDKLELNTE